MEREILVCSDLRAGFDGVDVVKGIDLAVPPRVVTAIMGPSGCGKTTFIRCLNRMHELAPNAHVTGLVSLDGEDIYKASPIELRRRIGMVFQRPNPFPTMSIYDNVLAGYALNGIRLDRGERDRVVEETLRKVALWDEVKGSLHRRGTFLSGGQQQRLCIARALAVSPEVILMDEPASALDPIATLKIEELMRELAEEYTIIVATHNMQQAARVSDYTAFFSMDEDRAGYLVEYGPTNQIFTRPQNKQTEDYVTGRFG